MITVRDKLGLKVRNWEQDRDGRFVSAEERLQAEIYDATLLYLLAAAVIACAVVLGYLTVYYFWSLTV